MPSGTVSAFDAHRGLGEVTDANGTTWPFHCVEIAGGARTIEVGTPVSFDAHRKLGRHEAISVTPRSD